MSSSYMKKKLFTLTCCLFILLCSRAQWQQTTLGGTIQALAVIGTNLFAGTANSGVYLSSNNGNNWSAVNIGLPDTNVRSFAVSGINLFAGTLGGGVFLTANNGLLWTPVNSGLGSTYIYALAVSGSNLFAGSNNGMHLSTNNGASWTTINTGITDTSIRVILVSGNNVFAGTYGGGVFLSTNNGSNWTSVNSGLTNLDVRALAVIGGNLFAGTVGGGVFLSSNNGTNWTAVNTGLTNPYLWAFSVSGNTLFAGTNGGVFLSPNNGKNWTAVNSGLTNTITLSLEASSGYLFAGISGSLLCKASLNDTIAGIVSVNKAPVSTGYTKLYSNAKGRHMALYDSVQVSGSGNYNFDNVFGGGSYVVYANATASYPLTAPTYGDSTVLWDSARVIMPASGTVTENIELFEMPASSGKGKISGRVVQGINYARMTAVGDPIGGVDVGVRKKPKNTLIASTTTNSNGDYSFNSIGPGNYQIYIGIPGLPMDTTYNPSVTGTDTVFNNLNFIADSAKIYISGTTGIRNAVQDNPSLTIYPNPNTGRFAAENSSQEIGLLQVFDVAGRLMFKQVVPTGRSFVDASHLIAGIYTVSLSSSEGRINNRLVILK